MYVAKVVSMIIRLLPRGSRGGPLSISGSGHADRRELGRSAALKRTYVRIQKRRFSC